jgi:hypothetical protein
VHLIAPQWTGDQNNQAWLLSPEGCAVPFIADRRVRTDAGESLVFSGLPPGRWAYLRTRNASQLTAALTGRGASLPAAQTFIVEAGKTTRVAVAE